jgi:hypothetical protein
MVQQRLRKEATQVQVVSHRRTADEEGLSLLARRCNFWAMPSAMAGVMFDWLTSSGLPYDMLLC